MNAHTQHVMVESIINISSGLRPLPDQLRSHLTDPDHVTDAITTILRAHKVPNWRWLLVDLHLDERLNTGWYQVEQRVVESPNAGTTLSMLRREDRLAGLVDYVFDMTQRSNRFLLVSLRERTGPETGDAS